MPRVKSRHPLLASLLDVLSASVWALGSQIGCNRMRDISRFEPSALHDRVFTRYLVNDTQFVCSAHSECVVKLNRFCAGYYESICISSAATKVVPI